MLGYLGTADGCKPNCADHGCAICTGLLEHSCEVCDEDHMMSHDGDGTCTFCKDTPDFMFSRTCTPRDHHWPNSHSTCEEGDFWDETHAVCRALHKDCDNECGDSIASSTSNNCCDLCDSDGTDLVQVMLNETGP
jgi:hypothetical protein